MLLVGLAMLAITTLRRTFLYRLLEGRAELLWGKYAQDFLIASSIIIVLLSLLWIGGFIWKS